MLILLIVLTVNTFSLYNKFSKRPFTLKSFFFSIQARKAALPFYAEHFLFIHSICVLGFHWEVTGGNAKCKRDEKHVLYHVKFLLLRLCWVLHAVQCIMHTQNVVFSIFWKCKHSQKKIKRKHYVDRFGLNALFCGLNTAKLWVSAFIPRVYLLVIIIACKRSFLVFIDELKDANDMNGLIER